METGKVQLLQLPASTARWEAADNVYRQQHTLLDAETCPSALAVGQGLFKGQV
jgi:hypothetical protein